MKFQRGGYLFAVDDGTMLCIFKIHQLDEKGGDLDDRAERSERPATLCAAQRRTPNLDEIWMNVDFAVLVHVQSKCMPFSPEVAENGTVFFRAHGCTVDRAKLT